MSAWWTTERPGKGKDVVLFQLDLMGHSKWALDQIVTRQTAKDRTEFAQAIATRLAFEGFDCLYWLGDGGVFARWHDSQDAADGAVKAADVAFKHFEKFKLSASGAEILSLRATATIVPVLIHPDSSHWFSTELNEFLKYERDLARKDAFVVTQSLYKELSDTVRERFSKTAPRMISLPSGTNINVYTDADHSPKFKVSPRSFGQWLAKNAKSFPENDAPIKGKHESHVQVGQTVVINTALSEEGYGRISLTEVPAFDLAKTDALLQKFGNKWIEEKEKAAKYEGRKGVPLRLTTPLSDDPDLYIHFSKMDFRVTYPFHKLLEENPEIGKGLVSQAFEFSDGRVLPTILVVDSAVIIAGESVNGLPSAERYLLLAHRRKRSEGGFNGNTWSASSEEQFSPVESRYGGRLHEQDRSLSETLVRGLKEEFLTPNYTQRLSFAFHAISLDLVTLSVQLLAIVKLPDSSFSEIKALWAGGEAVDRDEHDVLAAIKLEQNQLRKAISSESPHGLVEMISNSDLEERLKHPWHPRSKLRMASCLWLLEEGLL